jgi:hypothetical protein
MYQSTVSGIPVDYEPPDTATPLLDDWLTPVAEDWTPVEEVAMVPLEAVEAVEALVDDTVVDEATPGIV